MPFLAGDAFDPTFLAPSPIASAPPSGPPPDLRTLRTLSPLAGRVALIHASSFFHLFGEAEQAQLAQLLAGLLAPAPGSMLLGSHVAMEKSGSRPTYAQHGREMFCHGPDSWREMWEGVFGKGKVEVTMVLKEHSSMDGQVARETRIMEWSVTRI